MKKQKKIYLTTNAQHLGIFSKIIIIVLVIGMLLSHINFTALAFTVQQELNNIETKEDVTKDLSKLKRIEEIEYLRTPNSKTFLKENGLLETDVYGEIIHFFDNGVYKEVDNTLKLVNNSYVNKANNFLVSLPKVLNDNKISLMYQDKEIKIYYDYTNALGMLSETILRNKTNLKDEVTYKISNNESLQYIIKQNSIKENIILNSYVENYSYTYYLETTLRLERIGNEIHFFDGTNLVFIMNEYYMFDSNNVESTNISFNIDVINNQTYKITVRPSDSYLRNATYPVTIDPEITLRDGGIIDGITSLNSIDKEANTNTFLSSGSFSLANRNALVNNDDLVANLNVYIPREYNTSIADIITRNQLMYASITLTTISTNATTDTKVKMKYDGTVIDEVTFHNENVFKHTFNIIDALNQKIELFTTNDINMSFELYLDGESNTEITYSLGWNLGGDKPLITLGYLDDAGLNDYYTYEELPLDNESSIYISHNSGNLTYLFNDYTDNNLLNLSHIYNANRKYNKSIYGSGFNISYNEEIKINYSNVILTFGSGKKEIFYPVNQEKTEYIATDGSGDTLFKKTGSNGEVISYEIASNGGIKIYNSIGKLIKIYVDESERLDDIWNQDAKQITLSYDTNNLLKNVTDSYGNKIEFAYNTLINDSQNEIFNLANIKVYKKNNDQELTLTSKTCFEYEQGSLMSIANYKNSQTAEYIYFNYTNNGHIKRIYKNNNGYDFVYDTKNRVLKSKIYSLNFTNGDFLEFTYDKNGKKTIVTTGTGKKTIYTFDSYYHTKSIENNNGYTTFYKYEDIYFDDNGAIISNPNYNKNHTIKVKSNSFKNVINPIVNHGFEIITNSNIYGWTKNVSSGSSAIINDNSFLYGSKVLQLYKSTSGTSQVYQDVDVKKGIEYILTGYIKNVNNNGLGAYINVSGLNGTINTIQKSGNIKNTKDFCRYEYKFKPNYTGKVRITLVNNSVGYVYFDNIQINNNYVDTRYNYLENSSFENNTIGSWTGQNYTVTPNSDMFSENCGLKSLKLSENGTIYQSINSPGQKGDTFVFGGYCLYENYTGSVSIKLSLIKQNGVEFNSFTFDNSDINASYMMARIAATEQYHSIKIEIFNNSTSSYAYIDNLAIYKEGYGVNITYNEDGLKEEEYNEVTDELNEYEYDSNGNLISINKTSGFSSVNSKTETTSINYDSNGNVNSIENKNITSTYTTDSNGNITKVESETNDNEIKYYYGSTTYTPDGLYPKQYKDVFGNITTSTYDYITGLVSKIIDSDGVFNEYEYDKKGNITKLINGKGQNKKTVTYTYDTKGNVISITAEGLTYMFTYNSYNDIKTISVGGELLVTNNYKNESSSTDIYLGDIDNIVYNYGTVYFEYDEEGRIKVINEKSKNGNISKVLEYTYNDYSEIASYTDYKEGVTYYYNYDYQNRLINVNATNGNTISYEYDEHSHLVSKSNINGSNIYEYGNVSLSEENEKLIQENLSNKFNISYTYSSDSFSQMETISYYIQSNAINKNYTYETSVLDGTTYYTGRVKSLEYTSGNNQLMKFVYTYDKNNNIISVIGYENNNIIYQENNTYDIFNQLNFQNVISYDKNYFYEYNYNSRGNITLIDAYDCNNSVSLYSYLFTYRTTGNIDKLVKVESLNDNKVYNIEYSENGEPSLYFGWTISYDMKNITTLLNSDYEINYTYNANGIRTSKVVTKNNDTISTSYFLDGTNIIKEVRSGTQNDTLQYFYDSNDEIIGFTFNNIKYMYLKNHQKDIIGIVDSNNNIVVKYYYNGYGNVINKVDTSGINLSEANPFRYRSYYQDNETGWYYLNSRYYDANALRFITIDDVDYLGSSGSVLSYNLYSYCENNPIIRVDSNGSIWWIIIPIVIGAATLTGCSSKDYSTYYGAANKYVASSSKAYNCYAHALGLRTWTLVGLGKFTKTSYTVKGIANQVIEDLKSMGRKGRIIDNWDSKIKNNEYRIAVRVTLANMARRIGQYDYHFMVQHSNGRWSHKPGQTPTILLKEGANPSSKGVWSYYYNSIIIYMAITR